MKPILTLSQSGALYLAQHQPAQSRLAFFRRAGELLRLKAPDLLRRTFADARVSRRFHPDNGR